MGALGSPAQPHGQVGAEDSSASPQPAPPAAFTDLPLDSSLFPAAEHRQVAESGDPAARPPALLLSGRQPLQKREQKGSLGHAQALTSSCKFPLPAGLPAPRCSCSDELCAWVCFFPRCPPRFPLPRSSCSQALTHTPNSTSEERAEKQRMKRWLRREISPGLREDMRRFRITSVSFHSSPKSVGAGGGIADGSSHHHVAAGIKLFTLPSC